MNKKQLLLVASTLYAVTMVGQEQIASFTYLNQMTEKPGMIFDNSSLMDTMKRRTSDAHTWIESSLKENRSDTLNKSYIKIRSAANRIVGDLNLFSANMHSIKADADTLAKFRKDATHFSQYRDELKREIANLQKFKAQNEQARFRSGIRKEAKHEIADVLVAYAESFVKIAQKAINDFATIDAALYRQEKTPQRAIETIEQTVTEKTSPSYKRKARELSQEQLIPTTETQVEDVWADWDSNND
jgi:hypothetical protein